MQLNSITIMDLIAYGGAALGVILAADPVPGGPGGPGRLPPRSSCWRRTSSCPCGMLGSFFHIAMNGMAA